MTKLSREEMVKVYSDAQEFYKTREEMVKVFLDTQEFYKTNQRLVESIKNTRSWVYNQFDYPEYDQNAIREQKTVISSKRTFEAAQDALSDNPEIKVAVVNFANAFNPGGGVAAGCLAQEESLCRISTLYPVISASEIYARYYGANKKKQTPLATDSLIYSTDITVFKTDTDSPLLMPEEQWYNLDVITVAAPDLRYKYGLANVRYKPFIDEPQLFAIHLKRAIHLMTVAASNKVDYLVLGAFGCGAFRNDPRIVAKAYAQALDLFPKLFDTVEFAVYCSDPDKKNYRIFSEILNP
ncbi:MAG: TIGR02452 family protein [Succinivibrio sp.]